MRVRHMVIPIADGTMLDRAETTNTTTNIASTMTPLLLNFPISLYSLSRFRARFPVVHWGVLDVHQPYHRLRPDLDPDSHSPWALPFTFSCTPLSPLSSPRRPPSLSSFVTLPCS
jgi:hypothetical protein